MNVTNEEFNRDYSEIKSAGNRLVSQGKAGASALVLAILLLARVIFEKGELRYGRDE